MTHRRVEILYPKNPAGRATIVAWYPASLATRFNGEHFVSISRNHQRGLPNLSLICNVRAGRLSITYTVVAKNEEVAKNAALYLEGLVRKTGVKTSVSAQPAAHIKKLLAA